MSHNPPNLQPNISGTFGVPNLTSILSSSTITLPNNYPTYSSTTTIGNIQYAEVTLRADDIDVGGKSLKKFMEGVEKRLCILDPDPAMLDKHRALKEAYEHYLTLEALLQEDSE